MIFPEITFRSADGSDADRLISLSELSAGAPTWTRQTWQSVLASAGPEQQRLVLIAESANELVGFGVLGRAGESAEIESLAVSTAWRRRNIGRSICRELLEWARAHGTVEAFLEVRISNAAARALYSSMGFHEAATRRGYYRDPEEDALVMRLAL